MSENLIALGARADEQRRRRHGMRTTFVRVFEVHTGAVPAAWPASANAGEVRLVGRPSSPDEAASTIQRASALAREIPLTAYSLADLLDVVEGSPPRLRDLLLALKAAGLEAIAEAPLDRLPEPHAVFRLAHDAGLLVPRLTIHRLSPDAGMSLYERARDLQSAVGGIRAFAPLPRSSSIAQPSTGYEDVTRIAQARLVVDNIGTIQVDWPLYGPKLAQVALTMGADDVDGISPLEGDLGRRRSPLEEIRGNIRAAGFEPVERSGRFEAAVPGRSGQGDRTARDGASRSSA